MLDVVELVKRSIVGSEHLCYKGRAVAGARRSAQTQRLTALTFALAMIFEGEMACAVA